MGRKPKMTKHTRSPSRTPCYKLSDVKRLVNVGSYDVTGKALRTAADDFGWGKKEMRRFYLSLRDRHFYKTEPAKHGDAGYLDMYRAEMYGCSVYTHFYITDQGRLVIVNSFKRDTSGDQVT